MILIDAKQLEREITEKTSGYNERAKTVLWEHQRILHRQKTANVLGLYQWLIICVACFVVGIYVGSALLAVAG